MIEQPQSVTVISNQRQVQLRVERLAIHHRIKILEAEKVDGNKFYLFFYKDDFITGKTAEMKSDSLVEKAFQNGIVLQASHPLIDHFLSNRTLLLKSTKQVFQSVQKHYTPQETAFIFSYFDSFLSNDTIIKLMRKHFYEYRRNGQLRLAFQILATMLHFDPTNKWALELARKLEYQTIRNIYEGDSSELVEADPLFAEIKAYDDLKLNHTSLETIFRKEKRMFELSALRLHLYLQSPCEEELDPQSLIHVTLSEPERARLLWLMYAEAPHHLQLRKNAFEALMYLNKTSEAIHLLSEKQRSILQSEYELLLKAFQDESISLAAIDFISLQNLLGHKENRSYLDGLLHALIPRMLHDFGLSYVYSWVKPFIEKNNDLSILSTVQTMVDIQDDPDKQFQLGKLYHKMKQYDEAITCFDWEMELHPTDPTPVQWLTKVYREMGKVEESNTYMSIYSQMQRTSQQ
ncbi:tetratricopeptide repeat protein [Pseudalkalibacillus hwajinpoensis]|uniref:tetratricopeptide repeat protein n=1 Tax=Guptibacillus hwajinpoensis TaxID=208199 RepID=UPI001CD4257A|nr:tetratricopeptide repeat protein [Pseudalkalibacillus hwajinpoensis]MCA0992696.1 tetratricopeptide repeat protein [Pseudalkalibacillus hwajinpoensis]